MVKGLDVFREYFAGHTDQFVLIGGTAATLAMEEVGLEFRATKDLDIVLHIEALSRSFGEVFWSFIEAGCYEIRQASGSGKPVYYRFQKPADEHFPVMLELFCRAPKGIDLAEGSHLTPIPIDEAAASLSAILLDDGYYEFILAGRKQVAGLPWIGEDRLIPLKASAWLDLGERQAKGWHVDSKNIRKHANDALRLSQLLAPDVRIQVAPRIEQDLQRFLDGIEADRSLDPKSLGINGSVAELVQRIAQAYGLIRRRAT
ncbi:MAG: nucleotidyl transferase AbiEii/AbiGii toxin family protein [Steroidobacteraceae bacterium]|nr:nucleotidyl transferase AbiEii/AbiGii toxin family protein [Steroidobacteraceae bacterium]